MIVNFLLVSSLKQDEFGEDVDLQQVVGDSLFSHELTDLEL